MNSLEHAADVPAHKDINRDPADYVALNKSLRACFVCRLVKSETQFVEAGCDNCKFLDLEGDRGRVADYTTPNFSGLISVMDPSTSWATKWLHLSKYVPGCYTLMVNEDIPDSLQDILEDRGIKIRTAH
jgi:transcription elongation factor SPT4